MINTIDLEIYKILFPDKKFTEKYIGRIEFGWIYSKVQYTADCTIGIPFDLFDKTITGILQVDEVLSIEEIGEILGMNVTQDVNNHKYKDDAEYDILRMALDNLKNFKMIDTGDIHYSACRLTSLGKEYALRGKKFKHESNKSFSLIFDHTTNNHLEAHIIANNKRGESFNLLNSEVVNYDETFLRQIAAKQVPDISNAEKGNSFTNAQIKNGNTYLLKLHVVMLYDCETKSARLVVYDQYSNSINVHLSTWINDNCKESLMSKFSSFKSA